MLASRSVPLEARVRPAVLWRLTFTKEKMMDENQFWATIWKTAATAFSVLVVTVGGCSMNQQFRIVDLVADGADPIAAQCAIYGVESSNAAVCGAIASK